MKARLLVVFGAVTLACAKSNDSTETLDSGTTETVTPEGGATDAATAPAVDAADGGPSCSSAGWCETVLPDADLELRDLWPVPGHAFAIAESDTLGIKLLEWTDADSTWRYIDDTTQNAPGIGTYASTIWAASEDEVYFTVAPGWVFHGRRTSPGSAFTWSRQQLPNDDASSDPNDDYPFGMPGTRLSLGVWGADASHVHAWLRNTIFRFQGDDTEAWEPEFVPDVDAPNESVFFFAASGTTSDDVWFVGARTRPANTAGCALVVRKSGASYLSVADGELDDVGTPCVARANVTKIGGAEGWLTSIQSIGSNQFVALKASHDPIRIAPRDGAYAVDVGTALPNWAPSGATILSLFSTDGALWAGAQGLLFRGNSDVWSGGEYSLSSTALDGFPGTTSFVRVRGTSNTNLWAIGARNALHKTTP